MRPNTAYVVHQRKGFTEVITMKFYDLEETIAIAPFKVIQGQDIADYWSNFRCQEGNLSQHMPGCAI